MDIQPFLDSSALRHDHLCPRQVLGVRIGLLAAGTFGTPPGANPKKRLLAIVESDGCFSDGIEVSTGCSLGHRRLRLEDFGKVAATFVDTLSGRALRIAPRSTVRQLACNCQPQETRRYFAQLRAYQVLPDEDLLSMQEVSLTTPVTRILSRPGLRLPCAMCGEEIINERQVVQNGLALCRACAGDGYYQPVPVPALLELNVS
jgi:formylmethanofuran dehydrogenase subunit E